MASIPKVKVTFDADLDGLRRGTQQAEAEVSGFSGKVEKFGKMAAAAFAAAAAAAGAYALKLGVDGVKAAIADEQAQARLAQTLKAAAGATDDAVASTEKFISKMQLATGVSDDQLRSAMGRLTLSTNNVEKSQELLSLALDISKARGLSLETVANALGKAYDGQTTSLGKLGIGLSSAELKGKSFTDVQDRLSQLFGGAAARNADTFQGKIDIMRQRFGEFQESIGNKAIPVLMQLFNFIDTKISPAFEWLKTNAIDPVLDAINRNKEAFKAFGDLLMTYVVPILTGAFAAALVTVGKVAAGIIDIIGKVAGGITTLVNGAIGLINKLIEAYNRIPILPNIPTIPTVSAPSISVPKISVPSVSGSSKVTISSGSTQMTGGTGGGTSGAASTIAKAATSQSASDLAALAQRNADLSAARYMGQAQAYAAMANNVTINVSAPSVIDQQGFTNAVVDALNASTYRGTGGGGSIRGLVAT